MMTSSRQRLPAQIIGQDASNRSSSIANARFVGNLSVSKIQPKVKQVKFWLPTSPPGGTCRFVLYTVSSNTATIRASTADISTAGWTNGLNTITLATPLTTTWSAAVSLGCITSTSTGWDSGSQSGNTIYYTTASVSLSATSISSLTSGTNTGISLSGWG